MFRVIDTSRINEKKENFNPKQVNDASKLNTSPREKLYFVYTFNQFKVIG